MKFIRGTNEAGWIFYIPVSAVKYFCEYTQTTSIIMDDGSYIIVKDKVRDMLAYAISEAQ